MTNSATQLGDYVFSGAKDNAISPLDGFNNFLANVSSSTKVNYAEGVPLWSNDQSGFDEALAAVDASDVAVVVVRLRFTLFLHTS
jgi:beta-glucosidase